MLPPDLNRATWHLASLIVRHTDASDSEASAPPRQGAAGAVLFAFAESACSAREIADGTGLLPSTVKDCLRRLTSAARVSGTRNGRAPVYELAAVAAA
jgi:hypothetical protein